MHGYVPGLDGIRAVCITFVVLGHLGFGDLIPGGLGVTAFFFISGYLITGLLAGEHDRLGRVDLPRFYGRRALRLLPELAAFIAILGLAIGPALGQPLPLLQAFAAFTYWTNYYFVLGLETCANCSVTGHLWSLSVEEHFYLVMPLVMAACAFAPKRLGGVLAAVLVAGLTWRLVAHYGLGASELYTYKTTESRMDSIAWGCLAAVVQRTRPDLIDKLRARAGLAFAAGIALLLATLLIRDPGFRATLRYSLQGLALAAVILPLVNAPKLGWAVRLLELPFMRWMGRRSYGAYLWHYAALAFAGLALGVTGQLELASLQDRLLAMPITFALTWVLAALSYALVFKPCQALKPLLVPQPKPKGPAVAAEGLSASAGA
jgi:peptidoglycan/LPS O-acetylase OafA/YrhL